MRILFLAEPERGGFVNGTTVMTDGGWIECWELARMKKGDAGV